MFHPFWMRPLLSFLLQSKTSPVVWIFFLNFNKNTLDWRTLGILFSQLEHIKFTVINSLPRDSKLNIDVWSFICGLTHGALFVCVALAHRHSVLCVQASQEALGQMDRERQSSHLYSWADPLIQSHTRSVWPEPAQLFRHRAQEDGRQGAEWREGNLLNRQSGKAVLRAAVVVRFNPHWVSNISFHAWGKFTSRHEFYFVYFFLSPLFNQVG